MHSLTIVFGPSPVPWVLLFKTKEAADAARQLAGHPHEIFSIADDFGQEIRIAKASIHGMMLENMDLSKMAHIEQGLHRARTQAKAQELGAADPILKVAAMRQGPAMLNPSFPGGNGAFRGQ